MSDLVTLTRRRWGPGRVLKLLSSSCAFTRSRLFLHSFSSMGNPCHLMRYCGFPPHTGWSKMSSISSLWLEKAVISTTWETIHGFNDCLLGSHNDPDKTLREVVITDVVKSVILNLKNIVMYLQVSSYTVCLKTKFTDLKAVHGGSSSA